MIKKQILKFKNLSSKTINRWTSQSLAVHITKDKTRNSYQQMNTSKQVQRIDATTTLDERIKITIVKPELPLQRMPMQHEHHTELVFLMCE